MNKNEIKVFIEEMEKIGDIWTEKQVKDVYKDKSLKDAIHERKQDVSTFLTSLATTAIHMSKNKKDD